MGWKSSLPELQAPSSSSASDVSELPVAPSSSPSPASDVWPLALACDSGVSPADLQHIQFNSLFQSRQGSTFDFGLRNKKSFNMSHENPPSQSCRPRHLHRRLTCQSCRWHRHLHRHARLTYGRWPLPATRVSHPLTYNIFSSILYFNLDKAIQLMLLFGLINHSTCHIIFILIIHDNGSGSEEMNYQLATGLGTFGIFSH